MRDWLLRLCLYVIGLVILSFSISLIIKSELGAGAWDALNVGLSKTVGFTVGTWVFIIGFVLIFLNALLMKGRPMLTAIFTIIFLGTFIDFWLLQVFSGWDLAQLTMQIVVFSAALLLLGFGVALYLQSGFPINPIDNLMIALHTRFSISLTAAKTIGEVVALLLAFILNGPIGVGTVFITFAIGPIIGFFEPRVKTVLQHLRTRVIS